MSYNFIAIDTAGKKLYTDSSGAWALFGVQPTFGVSVVGTICIGVSTGAIICYSGAGGAEFHHYDPSTDSWSTKAKASAGNLSAGGGMEYDPTHIYAWGGGRVELFNGSVWSDLTSGGALTNGSDHGCVDGSGNLWICNRAANLWYYNGVSWSDVKAALPLISGYAFDVVCDVFAVGTNVYIAAICSAYAKPGLIKYNGSTYSLLTGAFFGGGTNTYPHSVWASGDSAVWVNGKDGLAGKYSVWLWNGSNITRTQLTAGATSGLATGGKTLYGHDTSYIASCAQVSGGLDMYTTSNATNWSQPTWPDAGDPNSVGVQYVADPSTPRAGDTLYYNAANLFGAVVGSIRFRFRAPTFTPTRSHYLVGVSVNGAATNHIHVFVDTSGRVCAESAKTAGAAGSIVITGNRCDGGIHEVLVTWQPNELRLCADGTWGTPDTSCDIPTGLTRLEIGQDYAAARQAGPILVGDVKAFPRFQSSWYDSGSGFSLILN